MVQGWKRTAALGFIATAALAACNNEGVIRQAGTLGVAELSASAIDFAAADCGGEAPESQSFTLTNTGEGPLRWSASIDSNAYFDLAGARSGTLEVDESATVTVTAKGMPSNVPAGTVLSASVMVTTEDPARPQTFVPVKATAQGATLELVAPSAANFGSVPVGADAPAIPLMVKNTGNAPAKVSIVAPADPQFGFAWEGGPDAVEVAPGATVPGLAATFKAATNKSASSAGLVQVEGAVCGESVKTIAVTGQGLAGTVGYSPGVVDLGKTGCNTQGAPMAVTVFNTGNLVYTWSATLKDGKNYTVSPPSGAVAPGQIGQIVVTPKPIGMTTNLGDNGFGDVLVFTTSIEGDTPHDIPVMQTASGAILKWNATPLDFGTIPAFTESAGKFITVTNEGNAPATVKVGGGDNFVSSGGTVPGNGGTLISTVKFKATNLGTQTAFMQLETTDPICQPIPSKVAAKGSGRGVAQQVSVGGPGRRGGGESGGCIVMKNSGGKVACFGGNSFGQLGTTNTSERGPIVIGGLPEVVQVTSGDNFHCALGKDGTVWCWGRNRSNNSRVGKIGSGAVDQSEKPIQVSITDAIQISAGHNMACAVRSNGTAACWGTNRRRNLGSGSAGGQLNDTPVDVQGVTTATQIEANGGGGCVRLNDGTARCWGRYNRGTLGNGDSGNSDAEPRQIAMGNIKKVMGMTESARFPARCALDNNGNLNCWGCRNYCQVGANGCGGRCRSWFYTPVGNLSGVTDAEGVWWGGCALMNDKTVRCWGRNDDGYVGNGGLGNVCSPQQAQNLANVDAIGAGGRGVCAVISDGSVKCWGNFGLGQSTTPTALKYF